MNKQEKSILSDMNNDDVIDFGNHTIVKKSRFLEIIINQIISKFEELIFERFKENQIKISSSQNCYDKNIKKTITLGQNWLSTSIDCSRLKLGSHQWQKGKIKFNVTVEFYPDEENNEVKSVLDDIRKSLN